MHCSVILVVRSFGILLIILGCMCVISDCQAEFNEIDPRESLVWGPGLYPQLIVLPARYFFIQAVDRKGRKFQKSPEDTFTVKILGDSEYGNCRTWINILNRKDGLFIARYKMYDVCTNLEIHVQMRGIQVGDSPYRITGPVYPDHCYCPVNNMTEWLVQYGCRNHFPQIENDLKPFSKVNSTNVKKSVLEKYNNPGGTSICHYAIKNNEVYRSCYGQHVGFKMFTDAIFLSLCRKVKLPDMELWINLGDWPLVSNSDKEILPMFSWCGSDDSHDIVMPTYDITEATLECMGRCEIFYSCMYSSYIVKIIIEAMCCYRVTLDMLSVQGNTETPWNNKVEKAFWRGRDSRRERLKLIDISRKHPDLFNASLTNFFFFRDAEDYYGPKEKYVSFFEFFNYKYQVNIDGTVAAYRFPYLLAGDSVVFKQESKYYEHFYKQLEPWKHFIPFKHDLSDLVDQILWAKDNDDKLKIISENGRKFAQENLLPQDIMCYHAVLFHEWSQRLISPIEVTDDMEHVPQPAFHGKKSQCYCDRRAQEKYNDEL